MKSHLSKLIFTSFVIVIAAVPALAAIVIDPSNSPWVKSAGDVVTDTTLDICNTATAEIQSGASVTISGTITVGQRNNPSTLSQLIASGGTVSSNLINVANKSEGDAYVEFSGATVNIASMTVGSMVSDLAGINTDVLHSAGDVSITGSTSILRIGSDGATPGTYPVINWTQTGGDFDFAGKFIDIGLSANNTATYKISGGTFVQSRVSSSFWGMRVGGDASGGVGCFHVDGYWDVAGVDKEIEFKGSQLAVNTNGTLKFTIYDANGTTLINVAGVDSANLLGTVDIDLDGYTPTYGDTFDLIKGATNYGSLSIAAADAADWSLSTNGDVLQATYIGATVVTVSTTAQLQAALAAASDGDLILMTSASYGNVYLNNYQFNSPVTVRAADRTNPPVITFMKPSGLKNVTFDGLKFFKSATVPDNGYYALVDVYPSENVTFTYCLFVGATITDGDQAGYGSGFGMKVRDCVNTTVRRCVFRNLSKCVSTSLQDSMTVEQNFAYDYRQDFLYIHGTDISIVDNIAVDNVPYLLPDGAGDHPDIIQGSEFGDTVISNNFFRGESQGVFCSGVNGDNTITNNIIQVAARNALRMNDSPTTLIAHNTVLGTDSAFFATVEAINDSQGTLVEYNIGDLINPAGTGVTYSNNAEVQREDINDPDYYADIFVDALADEDASIYDYALLAGAYSGWPVRPGADLSELFWLSVGDPSESTNEMYPLWLLLDSSGQNKLLGLLELD